MILKIQKIESLQKRMDNLEGAQNNVQIVHELGGRRSEAEKIREHVSEVICIVDMLEENKIPITINNADISVASGCLQRIIERFNKKSEPSSLVKGKDWAKLLEVAPQIKRSIRTDALNAWQAFVDGQFNGQTPQDLKIILAPTSTNNNLLIQYEEEYISFRSVRANIPEDREEIKKAVKHAERLKKLYDKFNRDVPEDVRVFLKGVASGGAGLSLLTEEVVEWLKKNNSFGSYHIY